MAPQHCPGCKNKMHLKKKDKKTHFRGVLIRYPSEAYVCPECGLESGTIQQAGLVQKLISDAYRKKTNLLTGDEIEMLRKKKQISQETLADALGVEKTLILKWEKGLIQSRMEDKHLRKYFQIER